MKKVIITVFTLSLTACNATSPMTDFASENSISLRYSAYDSVPTLTAEAREKAIQHCATYGKFANYRGGNSVNQLSAEEIHQFACEKKKTDDSVMLAAQIKRPEYVFISDF